MSRISIESKSLKKHFVIWSLGLSWLLKETSIEFRNFLFCFSLLTLFLELHWLILRLSWIFWFRSHAQRFSVRAAQKHFLFPQDECVNLVRKLTGQSMDADCFFVVSLCLSVCLHAWTRISWNRVIKWKLAHRTERCLRTFQQGFL